MSRIINTVRREFRGRRWSTGVAAVEFVVSVPLLIFAMLALAELGRVFVQYDRLSYAVRSSARFVSENAINYETGEVDVSKVAGMAKNLAVYGTTTPGTVPILPLFSPGHVTVRSAGDHNIEVFAEYPYQPLIGTALPLFGGGSVPTLFTLRISTTMRAIS